MIALTIPDRWRATQVAVTIRGRTPRRSRRGLSYFGPCRSCPAVLLLNSVIASQTSSTRASVSFSKIRPSGPALTRIAHCCGPATGARPPKTPQAASRTKIALLCRHARRDLAEARTVTPNVLRRLPRDGRPFGSVRLPGGTSIPGGCVCVVGVAQHLLGNNPVSSSVRRVMRSSPFGLMTFAGLSPIFTTPSWDRLT